MSRDRMRPEPQIDRWMSDLARRFVAQEQLICDLLELADAFPLWKYNDEKALPAVEEAWRMQRRTLRDRARELGITLYDEEEPPQNK